MGRGTIQEGPRPANKPAQGSALGHENTLICRERRPHCGGLSGLDRLPISTDRVLLPSMTFPQEDVANRSEVLALNAYGQRNDQYVPHHRIRGDLGVLDH